jgi:hypothetical protein
MANPAIGSPNLDDSITVGRTQADVGAPLASRAEVCPPASTGELLPRTVWLLWHQGLAAAPFIVRACVESWIRTNPGWRVVVLDANTLHHYVELDIPAEILSSLCLAHQSDLIRLQLLARYGGVWADATTFCIRPLDSWIDAACSRSGFFAFHRPARDRLIANWFLASQRGSPVAIGLYERLRSYWIQHRFQEPNRAQRRAIALLSALLNRSTLTTRFWFHPVVSQLLGIYPYFVFHYGFERLVAQDPACRQIWRDPARISAEPPRLIERLGLHSAAKAAIQRQLQACPAPLFKLTWKYDHSRYAPGTLLHHLIEPGNFGAREQGDNQT